jgi:uncharacterized protein
MTLDVLWWVFAVALMLLGVAGTVLPALPGTALVLAGIVIAAWIDDFNRVSGGTVAAVAVLAVLSWVLDYAAGLMGARHVGASREALVGAAIGTVAGLFMGLIGIFFMPLVGAVAGEYLAHRNEWRSLHVGAATWIGIMLGMIAKVVLAFVMIGVFAVALVV